MNQNPFRSFWMAGFECTDQLNAFGNRVDFSNLTGHLELLDEDYKRLIPFSIRTVREGIRWSHIEKTPYQYNWSDVERMIECGKANGLQQIWDLCHFGFPDDLTPLHPMFARRFAALCRAFVKFYRSRNADETLIITPINEVSFLSWLGGEARGTSPYCIKQGWEVKYSLMKAYIEGIAAILEIDPSVRILTTEPLITVVPPLDANEQQIADAASIHEFQFQVLDILGGNICPELGGSPDYLDILGFNYYFNNQHINGTNECLPWTNIPFDPRWKSLRSLLTRVYQRYQRPIALTETGHPGIDRPAWVRFITEECIALLRNSIPFWGICLYPIIDRPDWDDFTHWHHSGLWDSLLVVEGIPPERALYEPLAVALREAQQKVDAVLKEEAQGNSVITAQQAFRSE